VGKGDWEKIGEGYFNFGNQFGFMPGRLTIEAIHLIRKLMELYKDSKKNLHMVIINLEKVYDRVPREVLGECLQMNQVSVTYIRASKDMHEGTKTSVRTSEEDKKDFPIVLGSIKVQL